MDTNADMMVSEVGPRAAWGILQADASARLIDVRCRAEWEFVGCPDVSELGHGVICIEWMTFPDMRPNPAFVETVMARLGDHVPDAALFLCRSGVRSMRAAKAAAQGFLERGSRVRCINIAEGFEGNLDAQAHRGTLGGWKASGMPWCQT